MTGKLDVRLLVGILVICVQAHACSESGTDDGYACAGVGCASGFELLTTINFPIERVQQAEVSVCRNRECRTGKIKVDRGPGKDGLPIPERTGARLDPSSASGPGAAPIYVNVWPSLDPETLYLGMSWHWDWDTTPDAHNDVFDISIETNDATLYKTHRVVEKYSVSQPNGKDPPCGGLTCGLASSVDCPHLPDREPLRSFGVVKASDAPAMCPPADEPDAGI